MPELPEVESARKHAFGLFAGHRIVEVKLREQGGGPRHDLFDDIIFETPGIADIAKPFVTSSSGSSKKSKVAPTLQPPPRSELTGVEQAFHDALFNRQLENIYRKGKQIYFTFQDPDAVAVLMHFGMTGSFVLKDHIIPSYKSFKIKDGEKQVWPPKFTKLEVVFDHGVCLAYCDPRRLGRIKLRRDPLNTSPLKDLGIDPYLGPLPTPEELLTLLQPYSAPIKAILLDQEKIFCGIGNYLADEVLYQAGIHPEIPGQRLNLLGVKQLLDSLQSIINHAVSVDARYEDFPAEWLFHSRWMKQKSKSERILLPHTGQTITFETCGGRTSAIVLQKQPKNGGDLVVKAAELKKKTTTTIVEVKQEKDDDTQDMKTVAKELKKKKIQVTSTTTTVSTVKEEETEIVTAVGGAASSGKTKRKSTMKQKPNIATAKGGAGHLDGEGSEYPQVPTQQAHQLPKPTRAGRRGNNNTTVKAPTEEVQVVIKEKKVKSMKVSKKVKEEEGVAAVIATTVVATTTTTSDDSSSKRKRKAVTEEKVVEHEVDAIAATTISRKSRRIGK